MALSQWSPYEVPQSLWAVIELYAPTVELSEIKHIIGDDLIEQSNELFEEIYLLLDIWQSEAQEPAPIKKKDSLPESPFMREQFVSRIQQFVGNLDATKNHLLQSFLNERKEVYEYATQKAKRPSTSDSSNGRLTPCRSVTGKKSATPTDLSLYRDSMSAFEIDKIVTDIQAAFRDEHRVLKEDVEFLHCAIQDIHSERIDQNPQEPTLNDLKMFADDLEKKVIDLSQPVFASLAAKKPQSPQLKALPKIPRRGGGEDELKKLPSLPTGSRQLSWRQRTLKKVNITTNQETFMNDLELRGGSPSGSKERLLRPTPPPKPPRPAFLQSGGLNKQN